MSSRDPIRPEEGAGGVPVDYGSIRVAYQRVRAAVVLGLLALSAVSWAADVPGAALKTGVVSLVAVDAVVRARLGGGLFLSLLIDGAAAGLVIGAGPSYHAPLISFIAYATAASILFAGTARLLPVLAAIGTGLAGRLGILGVPDPTAGAPAGVVSWVEAGILLSAFILSLMAGASAMQAARRRQQAVIEAERRASEMKNEFVSMVTHELRTPLTNITGFALTMRDGWTELDPAEIDEFLRIIVGESEHLGNLVEDVLTIPRLEAGGLPLDATDFPLQPAAYKIADLLFPAGGEKSASVSIAGNVWVRADPNRVEQVLRNLLGNAREYGGNLVTVEATRRGEYYLIVVADDGPGVPPEHRERIFGAFEQARVDKVRAERGFGLGLTVSRHLVEAMRGRIWYENGFPVGARFCFTLPASPEADAGNPEDADLAAASGAE